MRSPRVVAAFGTTTLVIASLGVRPVAARAGELLAADPASTAQGSWRRATVTKLVPPSRTDAEVFGVEPRVSDRWLTVGCGIMNNQDPAFPDALQIFEKTPQGWKPSQCVSARDAALNDGFGFASAIRGDTIAVTAPGTTVAEKANAGAAYVLEYDGKSWQNAATLLPPNPAENAGFGQHIAFDADTIIVGEAFNGEPGGWAANRGVYVYARAGQSWNLQATIAVPDDLANTKNSMGGSHGFGNYVALRGDLLAVTALGAETVLLYQRTANTWRLSQRITAPKDPADRKGGIGFGRSLGLAGDTLVIGGMSAPGRVPGAGAAFVYRLNAGAWTLEQKLTAPDGQANDLFGHWVAIGTDTVAVGAFRATSADKKQTGAGYIFTRAAGRWTLARQFVPPADTNPIHTGYGVDLADTTAVFSAGSPVNDGLASHIWVLEAGKP